MGGDYKHHKSLVTIATVCDKIKGQDFQNTKYEYHCLLTAKFSPDTPMMPLCFHG
jgi:hypothetical protein